VIRESTFLKRKKVYQIIKKMYCKNQIQMEMSSNLRVMFILVVTDYIKYKIYIFHLLLRRFIAAIMILFNAKVLC